MVLKKLCEAQNEEINSRNGLLEELFDKQVRRLLDKDYPEAASMEIDIFLSYLTPLREKILKIGKVEDHFIPFLIVIPERFVSILKQLSLATINGKVGSNFSTLRLDTLHNVYGMGTSKGPYLIFDIDNGTQSCGASAEKCYEKFKDRGRRGLTVEEGIALVTHYSETLKHHAVCLIESRLDSHRVPSLWLNDDDENPILVWDWFNFSSGLKLGFPSCKR